MIFVGDPAVRVCRTADPAFTRDESVIPLAAAMLRIVAISAAAPRLL